MEPDSSTSTQLPWQVVSSTAAPAIASDQAFPWWKRELLFWLGQCLFWGAALYLQYTLFLPAVAASLSNRSIQLILALRGVTGVMASLLLRFFYNGLVSRNLILWKTLITAAAAILVATLLELVVYRFFLFRIVSPEEVLANRSLVESNLPIYYRMHMLTIWSLCFMGFFQGRKVQIAELRAAQAESAMRASELERLEAQLQPHFLFNALTAVLACRHEPDAVARVTKGLSEYLRFCLARPSTLEPLARELQGLEHFLVVQRIRFGDNLNCTIHASPEARSILVPPMLIGPLLDNAFKYGALTCTEKLCIHVNCHIENQLLLVSVTNTGTWVEPGTGRRGTGLENLLARLELLGIEGARLSCKQENHQVRVQVTIPCARATLGTRQPRQELRSLFSAPAR